MASGALMYQLVQLTNNITDTVWYALEVSSDGGNTWNRVNAGSGNANWAATNGWVMGQNETTMTAIMNAYHAAAVADFNNQAIWTVGSVVAGPL